MCAGLFFVMKLLHSTLANAGAPPGPPPGFRQPVKDGDPNPHLTQIRQNNPHPLRIQVVRIDGPKQVEMFNFALKKKFVKSPHPSMDDEVVRVVAKVTEMVSGAVPELLPTQRPHHLDIRSIKKCSVCGSTQFRRRIMVGPLVLDPASIVKLGFTIFPPSKSNTPARWKKGFIRSLIETPDYATPWGWYEIRFEVSCPKCTPGRWTDVPERFGFRKFGELRTHWIKLQAKAMPNSFQILPAHEARIIKMALNQTVTP
jgi:hypothetical protein